MTVALLSSVIESPVAHFEDIRCISIYICEHNMDQVSAIEYTGSNDWHKKKQLIVSMCIAATFNGPSNLPGRTFQVVSQLVI
jgi:hypothetical protein